MTRLLPCAVLSLLVAANCFAHDTWLSPSTYAAQPGEMITVDMTSGMEFPKLDSPVKRSRVAHRGSLTGGEPKWHEADEDQDVVRLQHSFPEAVVATLWVELKPKEIELSDDDVAHYLEEARAPEEVQKAWAEQKGRAKWKELYTKCAKTCIAIGSPDEDRSWASYSGMTLEFVPLTNPTTLRVGDSAQFKLLRNREPLAGAAVALHSEGDAGPRYATTDAQGVVTFSFEAAGPTMLATVYLRPPAEGKPWESEFSTITFETKAK